MKMIAVSNYGLILEHVQPSDHVTYYDLCLLAVRQNGMALKYVKNTEDNLTPEQYYNLCMETVRHVTCKTSEICGSMH